MQKWEELAYAREDGMKEGKQATYIELLKDGLISPIEVAKRLQLSVQEVEQMMK